MNFGNERRAKYRSSEEAVALRQGEILSNITHSGVTVSPDNTNSLRFRKITHAHALIVTPDCDLEWDYQARQNDASQLKLMPNVLLCILRTASEQAKRIKSDKTTFKRFENSSTWKRITQNKEERYHFLEKFDAVADLQNRGIPFSLCIDFKEFFTVPTEDLYESISSGETLRRCRLVSPYREHFNNRFAYFLSRIGLPEDMQYSKGEIYLDPEIPPATSD